MKSIIYNLHGVRKWMSFSDQVTYIFLLRMKLICSWQILRFISLQSNYAAGQDARYQQCLNLHGKIEKIDNGSKQFSQSSTIIMKQKNIVFGHNEFWLHNQRGTKTVDAWLKGMFTLSRAPIQLDNYILSIFHLLS